MDADSPMGMTIYIDKNSNFWTKTPFLLLCLLFHVFVLFVIVQFFFNHQTVEMLTNVISDNAH